MREKRLADLLEPELGGGAPLLRLAGAPPSLLVVMVELGRDAHEYRKVVAKDPPGRERERRERWRANERDAKTQR